MNKLAKYRNYKSAELIKGIEALFATWWDSFIPRFQQKKRKKNKPAKYRNYKSAELINGIEAEEEMIINRGERMIFGR